MMERVLDFKGFNQVGLGWGEGERKELRGEIRGGSGDSEVAKERGIWRKGRKKVEEGEAKRNGWGLEESSWWGEEWKKVVLSLFCSCKYGKQLKRL